MDIETATVDDGRAVYVLDDEDAIRAGMAKLLLAEGYDVRTFDSAESFLERSVGGKIACIVLDLQMPGLSGLELQEHLLSAGRELPIVFVTAHGDIPDSVRAMKQGAVSVLEKPYSDDELLGQIREAVTADAANRRMHAESDHVAEVLSAVGGNRSHAADILGISRPRLRRLIQKYHLGGVVDDDPEMDE